MNEYKIVFTGPVGVGKTTAISAVSDALPIRTEAANADVSVEKFTTTVAFDYGDLKLGSGDRLRLYGTPGQSRFNFMWKILVSGALGLIVLLDNSRPDPISDLDTYLCGFADSLSDIACAIGVSRFEKHPFPSIEEYSSYLAARGMVLPIVHVDVRQRKDVSLLIDLVLTQVEAFDA